MKKNKNSSKKRKKLVIKFISHKNRLKALTPLLRKKIPLQLQIKKSKKTPINPLYWLLHQIKKNIYRLNIKLLSKTNNRRENLKMINKTKAYVIINFILIKTALVKVRSFPFNNKLYLDCLIARFARKNYN